ncbi:protein of unknown function [Cyanobium sp. NIES-981]|nr:protein of unknown function [Cyanobium sp. NIES-981]
MPKRPECLMNLETECFLLPV